MSYPPVTPTVCLVPAAIDNTTAAYTLPANTVAPVNSKATNTFTTTNGTWTGFPAVTFTYQWQQETTGAGGASWVNVTITGNTTNSINAAALHGVEFRCLVTATNIVGSVTAPSNTVAGQA